MAGKSKRKTVEVVRSSVTGQFVPKGRAKSSPRTTETERIRRPRRKK